MLLGLMNQAEVKRRCREVVVIWIAAYKIAIVERRRWRREVPNTSAVCLQYGCLSVLIQCHSVAKRSRRSLLRSREGVRFHEGLYYGDYGTAFHMEYWLDMEICQPQHKG